jgi:hypothetical protein
VKLEAKLFKAKREKARYEAQNAPECLHRVATEYIDKWTKNLEELHEAERGRQAAEERCQEEIDAIRKKLGEMTEGHVAAPGSVRMALQMGSVGRSPSPGCFRSPSPGCLPKKTSSLLGSSSKSSTTTSSRGASPAGSSRSGGDKVETGGNVKEPGIQDGEGLQVCSYAAAGYCQVPAGGVDTKPCPFCNNWQHHMCTTEYGLNKDTGQYENDGIARKQEAYEEYNSGVCYDCFLKRALG